MKIFYPILLCGVLLCASAPSGAAVKGAPKKAAEETAEAGDQFYTWPVEKRIADLKKRDKNAARLSAEEKAKLKLQIHETMLLTFHDICAQALVTIRTFISPIAAKVGANKMPIEKFADYVYLLDGAVNQICDKEGNYKKNLAKLFNVSNCMLLRPWRNRPLYTPRPATPVIRIPGPVLTKREARRKRRFERENACKSHGCTYHNQCMAVGLNCGIIALKPLADMFAKGVDVNGQHIDSGLVIIARVIAPMLKGVSAIKLPEHIEQLVPLILLSIKFLAKTRDMYIALGQGNDDVLTKMSGTSAPPPPAALSGDLARAQAVFNTIGSLATMAGRFSQGFGKGPMGTVATSLFYSVINLANMGTDIISLINSAAYHKITNEIGCLLKKNDKLLQLAKGYKGKPLGDMSCPGLGCLDMKTCHALTMVSLGSVIRPLIENFIGKVEIDSAGKPTNKVEMGLLLNVTNALTQVLKVARSAQSSGMGAEEERLGRLRRLFMGHQDRLERLQEQLEKAREMQIMLARAFPRLIQAVEQSAFQINPEIAKYVALHIPREAEELEEVPEPTPEEKMEGEPTSSPEPGEKTEEKTPPAPEPPAEELKFDVDTLKEEFDALKTAEGETEHE